MRRKLRHFPRLGGRLRFRMLGRPLFRVAGRVAGFLFRSQILTVFLGLCGLGILVGVQTRPAPGTFPYAELFDQLQVVSYRDAPTDTSSRFVVQLCAGGRAFSQYDVEHRAFLPPPRGRSYARAITGTHYEPLRLRGHVGSGFWLDLPSRRALLPEQYDELYRRTIDFVRPLSQLTAVLGILSGYSVGYRLGTWNGSLSSRAVQERVLSTPDLGRIVAREAWRRVLLEPVVMTGELDASRFIAVATTHQLYANFYRLALDDRDGFIPREVERLEKLGHFEEARAMRAFAEAVRRSAQDSVHVTDSDFEAVERWATLLDRRGHWMAGAIPPPGEERIKLMGALAWYGLAPPSEKVNRVWVGPRMLVRVGDAEGFVADEIPKTGAGCPISWRPRLWEENTGASAMVGAWLADRPEFTALAVFGRRIVAGLEKAQLRAGSGSPAHGAPGETPFVAKPSGLDAALANRSPTIASEVVENRRSQSYEFSFPTIPGGSIRLLAADSAEASSLALAARAVVERVAPSESGASANDAATGLAAGVAAAADTLRARGVRDALIELPGTTLALGASADGEPWVAELGDPRARMPVIARIRLAGGQALASSARREPSPGLIGVAVVAADSRLAALWSATLLALDPGEARVKARQNTAIGAVLIEAGADGNETIWIEADLENRFVLDGHAQSLFRVVAF